MNDVPIAHNIIVSSTSRRIHLKWDLDPKYNYYKYDILCNDKLYSVSGLNIKSYTITSLENNKLYFISIRVWNQYGFMSEYSAPIGPIIPVVGELLPAIENVHVSIDKNMARLTWDKKEQVESYALFRKIDEDTYKAIAYVVENKFEEKIDPFKTYSYRIAGYKPAEGEIITELSSEVCTCTEYVEVVQEVKPSVIPEVIVEQNNIVVRPITPRPLKFVSSRELTEYIRLLMEMQRGRTKEAGERTRVIMGEVLEGAGGI
jgi:hypothetical protein